MSKKVIEVGNCTMWSEIPTDLLELICKRVGVIEYLMCACVCKSWRSAANSFRQRIMASQGPLLFLMPRHASNHGYFYNVFEKRLYRTALPHLTGTRCMGFTCGYLVLSGLTEDTANIWLVNPFTGHELKFPSPPNLFTDVVLASLANSDQEFVVIAFSRIFPCLRFRRSGDADWTVSDYNDISRMINDVAVCRGKIYALSIEGEIYTLNLNDPPLKILPVRSVPVSPYRSLHLVASHEELYIVCFYPVQCFTKIYKLDFEMMQWEEVKLQGDVLFLGDLKCCGFSLPVPSRGRGRGQMNRIWYLPNNLPENISGNYVAVYVSELLKMPMSVIPKDREPPSIFFLSPIWYFPHLSSSVDSVNED